MEESISQILTLTPNVMRFIDMILEKKKRELFEMSAPDVKAQIFILGGDAFREIEHPNALDKVAPIGMV